jgi:hypothetical protein
MLTVSDWIQTAAILAGFSGILLQHHLEKRKAERDSAAALTAHRRALIELLNAALFVSENTTADLALGEAQRSIGSYVRAVVTVHSRLVPYRDLARTFDIATLADATLWSRWAYFRQILEVAVSHLEEERAWLKTIPNSQSTIGPERFSELDTLLSRLSESIRAITDERQSKMILQTTPS